MFDILKQISTIIRKEPKVIHLPASPDRRKQLLGKVTFSACKYICACLLVIERMCTSYYCTR